MNYGPIAHQAGGFHLGIEEDGVRNPDEEAAMLAAGGKGDIPKLHFGGGSFHTARDTKGPAARPATHLEASMEKRAGSSPAVTSRSVPVAFILS